MDRTAAERELRKNLIRLAHAKPELRAHLLPLLDKQARTWDGQPGKAYNKPPAISHDDCYDESHEPKDTAGAGTCYRLHNEYGSGVSKNKSEYNKKYREKWMNNDHNKKRKTCPDGSGGKMDC